MDPTCKYYKFILIILSNEKNMSFDTVKKAFISDGLFSYSNKILFFIEL